MRDISDHDGRQNRVTAVWEARILSFDISITTTLEELAGRLVRLGERHREALLGVEITKTKDADAAGQPWHLHAAATPRLRSYRPAAARA
jgi:hypothetical protein